MISSSWLIERPIAHRGLHDASKGIQENSLQAFAEACRQGYPVELDVQFDDEQRLIVSHGQPDAGTAVNNHAKPPTLAEVFDLIQGRVPILIEIKDRGLSGGLEAAVADAVHGYPGDVALASFNPLALLHLRRMKVDRPIGQISGLLRGAKCALVRAIGRSLVSNYLTRPDFLAYELAGLPAGPVARNRAKGIPVIVWGVRSPSDEVYARKYGDNVIFSGYQPQNSSTSPSSNLSRPERIRPKPVTRKETARRSGDGFKLLANRCA